MKEFEANNENDYLPLRDVVFNTLRTSILTGELKPGERLMEIHLADKLGVSRTPIREAIRKLELEGLVTMIPRRGAEVAQITEKNLRDVLEVRRALDALAAACKRAEEGREAIKPPFVGISAYQVGGIEYVARVYAPTEAYWDVYYRFMLLIRQELTARKIVVLSDSTYIKNAGA